MKNVKHISLFIASIALMVLVGCASTTKKESVGEYFDDSVITAKVKTAVLNEPTLKATQIKVETIKGIVQLSGVVDNQRDIDKAVEVARGISGVRFVKNAMHHK